MKTREQLDGEFADELRGLLMESFAESRRTGLTDHSANGKMMFDQLCRAKALLDRIDGFYLKLFAERVKYVLQEHPELRSVFAQAGLLPETAIVPDSIKNGAPPVPARKNEQAPSRSK